MYIIFVTFYDCVESGLGSKVKAKFCLVKYCFYICLVSAHAKLEIMLRFYLYSYCYSPALADCGSYIAVGSLTSHQEPL